jgi:hypothetical protein
MPEEQTTGIYDYPSALCLRLKLYTPPNLYISIESTTPVKDGFC